MDHSVTLPEADWQVIRAALYKLPIEVGLATLQRFELAMAPTPERSVPHIVESTDG